jgi:hypothetical protein
MSIAPSLVPQAQVMVPGVPSPAATSSASAGDICTWQQVGSRQVMTPWARLKAAELSESRLQLRAVRPVAGVSLTWRSGVFDGDFCALNRDSKSGKGLGCLTGCGSSNISQVGYDEFFFART